MDYVVGGFGIGAVFALVGFALWELFGASDESGQHWLGRTAIGLMLGALVIWAVTGVSLLSTLDDSTASRVVLLTTLVALVAIAGVSAWYWHVERSLPVARPRTSEVRKTAVAKDTSQTVLPNEWDTWPDRDVLAPAADPILIEPEIAASFVPEVAAEPTQLVVESAPVEVAAELPADQRIESPDSEPGDNLLTVETSNEIESQVIDTDRSVPGDAPEPTVVEVDRMVAREHRPVSESASHGLDESEKTERSEQAKRRRSLRRIDATGPERPVSETESQLQEPVTDPLAGVEVALAAAPEPEPLEPATIPTPVEPPGPVAFESALLSDIDISPVEEDGRYRSPLLADLESNPDELEGVGLAKWRPEARLTADEPQAPPRRSKR